MPLVDRRGVLVGAATAVLAGPAGEAKAKASTPGAAAAYYVPGYRVQQAFCQGQPVHEHPRFRRNLPRGYDGNATLLTRLDERGGSLRRTLLPVRGHDVSVSPGRRFALFNSHNGPTLAAFDPETLELAAFLRFEDGIEGGGHSAYLGDGSAVAVAERRSLRPYSGDPRAHHGRIAIRDSGSLRLLESYDCHAIAPHEIAVTGDGRHLVVANYGSTAWPAGQEGPHRYVVEPAITVLELASGRLVHRFVPARPASEYRHLVAPDLRRIFLLQNTKVPFAAVHEIMAARDEVYHPDLVGEENLGDLPTPVLRADFAESGSVTALPVSAPARMVRAQSIAYDPAHDEVLATFTASNSIAVFGGRDGALKRLVDTGPLGLRFPRGIALHPDGRHYAVAGSWQDLYLFERGSHRLVRERCLYATFFDHSHIEAA